MSFTKTAYHRKKAGFTLIETLVVVTMVGIISVIAAPTWLRFLARHRVIGGQDTIHKGVHQAQLKSQQESLSWQLSIRENNKDVEMAVHPATISPLLSNWEQVSDAVILDDETNLPVSNGISYVQFDAKGNVRYRLGTITLSSERFSDIKHCVIISTLIGNTRNAKDRPIQRDGKHCY